MKPAVFLDRDGVLVENIDGDYIREKSQIKLLPYAKDAIAKLGKHGFEIIIITNQACVGKGLITVDDAWAIQKEIVHRLAPTGAIQIKTELCPHMVQHGCSCRKPQPGMILSASKKYDLELPSAYMIGDALSDIQAARTAGVRPIFVSSGRGRASDFDDINDFVITFDHIGSAADYICGDIL